MGRELGPGRSGRGPGLGKGPGVVGRRRSLLGIPKRRVRVSFPLGGRRIGLRRSFGGRGGGGFEGTVRRRFPATRGPGGVVVEAPPSFPLFSASVYLLLPVTMMLPPTSTMNLFIYFPFFF